LSAHLESGAKRRRAEFKAAITSGRLIKLTEAARQLGCHVETLRLRVRSGELDVSRGPHGTYYVRRSALDTLQPPRRSGRRHLELAALEWSWLVLEARAEELGAGRRGAETINTLHKNPSLDRRLHRLLSVHRLRLAGLTSAEVAGMLRISTRQVRRLSARHLGEALENSPILEDRADKRANVAARKLVAGIQLRLEESGFRYHQRPWQPGDEFTPRGRRAPAHKAKKLFREEYVHLHRAGLTDEEIKAIRRVGIGQDELNELILRGLRDHRLAGSTVPTPAMPNP
jgi:hypothetical protein